MANLTQLILIFASLFQMGFAACSRPSNPPNGFITDRKQSFEEFSSLPVMCIIGFRKEGPDMQCRSERWQGRMPRCIMTQTVSGWKPMTAVTTTTAPATITTQSTATTTTTPPPTQAVILPKCVAPTEFDGGLVTSIEDDDQGRMRVRYSCKRGTKISGSDISTCTRGTWSPKPVCIIVTCPTPPLVPNAIEQHTEPSYNFRTVKYYKCKENYILTGKRYIYCLSSGRWTPTTAKCTPENNQVTTCNKPSLPSNSLLPKPKNSYSVGESAIYECILGFEMDGTSTIKCLGSGTWEPADFRCSVPSCTYPGAPTKGKIVSADFAVGSSIVYECDDGYTLYGVAEITCLTGKVWSSPVPDCRDISCDSPKNIDNAIKQNFKSLYSYQSTVTYTCKTGYKLSESDGTISCLLNNRWSSAPSCIDVTCESPNNPINGRIRNPKSVYKYQDIVRASCNSGYEDKGSLVCNEDGKWLGSVECEQDITCKPPSDIKNAIKQKFQSSYNYKDTITYKCKTGFTFNGGDGTIECLQSSEWSSSATRCVKVTCSSPNIANGAVRNPKSSYQYQDSITASCGRGFQDKGSFVCNEDGDWVGNLVCEQMLCSPPNIENGKVDDPNLMYVWGEELREVTCNFGYIYRDIDGHVCIDGGKWTSIPKCDKLKTCTREILRPEYSSKTHYCDRELCLPPREGDANFGEGWAPAISENKPYLQVDFAYTTYVSSLMNFGTMFGNEYTDSITIEYKQNYASEYKPYMENGKIKIFRPFSGDDSIFVDFDLGELSAVSLRIYPTANNLLAVLRLKFREHYFC